VSYAQHAHGKTCRSLCKLIVTRYELKTVLTRELPIKFQEDLFSSLLPVDRQAWQI